MDDYGRMAFLKWMQTHALLQQSCTIYCTIHTFKATPESDLLFSREESSLYHWDSHSWGIWPLHLRKGCCYLFLIILLTSPTELKQPVSVFQFKIKHKTPGCFFSWCFDKKMTPYGCRKTPFKHNNGVITNNNILHSQRNYCLINKEKQTI